MVVIILTFVIRHFTISRYYITRNLRHPFICCKRLLPWKGSRASARGGATEDVRPINWANRTKSYILRTECWDEYPNGRWGDGRSPAFGDLSDSHFFKPSIGTREDRLAMWGEAPLYLEEVYTVFAEYLEGKIPLLPWCETAVKAETSALLTDLIALNRRGFLTINSQPAVNAVPSGDECFGWGGPGGYVYQKAYVEFFASPKSLAKLRLHLKSYSSLSLYSVDSGGNYSGSDHGGGGVTAPVSYTHLTLPTIYSV